MEADRQVANTLAELIIGGSLASVVVDEEPRGSEDSDRGHKHEPAAGEGDEGTAA